MWTSIAADLTVLFHLGFILFVFFGALLVMKWGWVIYLHIPAMIWGILIELMGWICPLTPLENHLRKAAGQAGYEGGFVDHYIIPIIYPEHLTREFQITMAVLIILINAAIYYRIKTGKPFWTK